MARATTHRVPPAHPHIQAAVDAASAGDTVLVAPGVYTGYYNTDVHFRGRDVILRSEVGPEGTVVDGTEGSEGWFIGQGETRATVVEGLSFVRMRAGFSPGGGLRLSGSSPTIRNCVYAWDAAVGVVVGVGGAIASYDGFPLIEGCTITSCAAAFLAQGIACYSGTMEIRNTICWGNCGYDIYTWDAGVVQLTCCVYGSLSGWGQFELDRSIQAAPMFCGLGPCEWPDTADVSLMRLMIDSPCLPQNNVCGVLIGALGVGCPAVSIPSTPGEAARVLRLFPNPASTQIECAFDLTRQGRVRAELFDAAGRLVLSLMDGDAQSGSNSYGWKLPVGRTGLAGGVYYLLLETPDGSAVRRVTLFK